MKQLLIIISCYLSIYNTSDAQITLDPSNFLFGVDSITAEPQHSNGFFFFSKSQKAFRGGSRDLSTNSYYHEDSLGTDSFGYGRAVTASGQASVAIGEKVTASGPHTFALGYIADASGFGAMALGSNAKAFGNHSLALSSCNSYGDNSVATGYSTEPYGAESFTMGNKTRANGSASLVIGAYNDTVVAVQDFFDHAIHTPYFIIGNGSNVGNSTVYSNAFEVYNNGFFVFNPTETSRDFQITSYHNGTDYHPVFRASQDGYGYVGTAQTELKAVYANEVYANLVSLTSDARLKENIVETNYGLSIINQLRAVNYNYIKDDESKDHIGFIAQEISEILPQLVNEKEDGHLSVNYIELIPVLVKAMQEQQKMINQMQKENEYLKESINAIIKNGPMDD